MAEETKSVETTTEKEVTKEVVESVLDSSKAVSSKEEIEETDRQGQIEHVMRMAATNPEVAEMDEIKNLMTTAEKVRKNGATKEVKEEEPILGGKIKEEVKEEVKEEAKEEPKAKEEEEEVNDEDDVFGLQDKKVKSRHDFKDDSDFKEYIGKKYSINDYNKFLSSVDKWRNDSQQYIDMESKHGQLVEGLGSLPQPIKDAIDAYANARDYKKAFTASVPLLDYSIDLEEVSKENVVKFYYKEKLDVKKKKLDDGDIYEEDYKDYVNDLYDSASRLFRSEKKDWERQRADIVSRDEDRANALKTSANSSVDSLKDKYPNFSSNELKKIRTRLVQQDLNNLFFDRNGAYKIDAAEKVALTLYGDKIISALKKQANRDGETKANLDIVNRGKDTIETKGKSNSVDNQEAKEAVSYLSGQFNKDPYS